jgi:hypothetical protein
MASDGFVDYHVHSSWYFALSIRLGNSNAPTNPIKSYSTGFKLRCLDLLSGTEILMVRSCVLSLFCR